MPIVLRHYGPPRGQLAPPPASLTSVLLLEALKARASSLLPLLQERLPFQLRSS